MAFNPALKKLFANRNRFNPRFSISRCSNQRESYSERYLKLMFGKTHSFSGLKINRYVQRPPQYNVPQQMNRYRAPPQQYRPQYMPQQAQQQYTPQPQGFMPQVQPMRVPQIPCNCGKKGQMTKTIVSGGKKVKVTVKKNGKANATVTAAKGSKVKVSKAPKVNFLKGKSGLTQLGCSQEKESQARSFFENGIGIQRKEGSCGGNCID